MEQVVDEVDAPTESVGDGELPISLDEFASLLRPQPKRDQKGAIIGLQGAGHVDEIWLKHLRRRHRFEKHSETGWRKVIDGYRDEPAHPAGMK